jgi:hemerythrin-like domain-containing protein
MKPRGPLMTEHRLIEKMLLVVKQKVSEAGKNNHIDGVFVDTMVDFIKVYADRTHHGKEEEILFKELVKKKMNQQDTTMLEELINDHKQARNKVKSIVEAKDKYLQGDTKSLETILHTMKWLIDFYPIHILKEDKEFFPNTEAYFSKEELDRMLEDFREFDRNMIHEKYQKVVESFNQRVP